MEKKAQIFNIQKFCLHDGPGIRTTVFFKGCPLHCNWCANPESQHIYSEITYDEKKCLHCNKCLNASLIKASSPLQLKKALSSSKEKQNIVSICPNNALSYEGEKKTVGEIIRICLQDTDFYEESDGGVTISGGEGFFQPEILHQLIKQLKKHKIHTAIETTGYVEEEIFKKIAPEIDLLLFDVKHYDSEKHKEGTGVNNELILKNLKWATDNGLDLLVRIPVIPGFNNSLKDAENLADLLLSYGIDKVQLLPFHQFGERKYQLLNRDYIYENQKALKKEDLEDYLLRFKSKGVKAFF